MYINAMHLSKYYANLLAAQGIPHLNVGETRRLFNIIVLEARIDELAKIIEHRELSRTELLRKERLQDKLYKLTSYKHAADVMADMLKKSGAF
ncbi:hypothetical protein [Tamlana flava]|uniref:hypothetical protein n=1 Tax=Tamlana flava TaxID=3158572 RepID=UPI00351AE8EA